MTVKCVFSIVMAMLAIGLMAIPACATDTTFPVLDNQVAVRQAHLAWKIAEQESGMQSAIGYIGTLEGADTSKLSAIESEFSSIASTVGSLDTHAGLNSVVHKLVQKGIEFRLEGVRQMVAGKGSWTDLRAAISAGLDRDAAAIDALELAYRNTRTDLTLENFHTRVDRAQKVLDALKAKGYDTAPAQATLDAIRAKEAALKAALESQDTDQVRTVWAELNDLSKQLAAQVKDLQVQVPQEKKIRFWIGVGTRAVDRAGQVIGDLERLGIDTSTLEPVLDKARNHLKVAQDAAASGDLTGAQLALSDLRTDFRDLAGAYRDLAGKEKLTGKSLREARSMAGALDSAADQIKEIA
jgi:hypothetical protein